MAGFVPTHALRQFLFQLRGSSFSASAPREETSIVSPLSKHSANGHMNTGGDSRGTGAPKGRWVDTVPESEEPLPSAISAEDGANT